METPEVSAPQAIKDVRRARLWSVRRLARESGLSAAYISQIESEKRPLTPRATARIAEALSIPAHDLLTMAGFIPRADLEKAQGMAVRAMQVPAMVQTAHGRTDNDRRDWLIDDYLMLLGHSPSGIETDYGPGAHWADWRLVDPNAPESKMRHDIEQWKHAQTAEETPASPIEGWDDLTDADRAFIQQMVNKLRRPTTGE